MPIDPQEFARMLGAEIVGEVPDVGGGPFGMARLAHIMHQCLTPSHGERPGRPTNPNWSTRCKVPMSDATLNRLTQLAEDMSTTARKVSPMQVAAQLLEEAIGRVSVQAATAADALTGASGGLTADTGAQVLPTSQTKCDETGVDSSPQTKLREAGPMARKQSRQTPIKIKARGDQPPSEGRKAGQRRKKT